MLRHYQFMLVSDYSLSDDTLAKIKVAMESVLDEELRHIQWDVRLTRMEKRKND